jgi:hypothetical protein
MENVPTCMSKRRIHDDTDDADEKFGDRTET